MITYEEAKETWDYNPDTGELRWKIKIGTKITINKIAGSIKGQRYRHITLAGKLYYAHRLAWLLTYKKWPNQIDHINGDCFDNRLCNLRNVTASENQKNRKLNKNNISGVSGIKFYKTNNKWRVHIKSNGSSEIHLGYYKEWWDAVCARKAAERLYNFHPNHGRN
jgi:hypothetical protein